MSQSRRISPEKKHTIVTQVFASHQTPNRNVEKERKKKNDKHYYPASLLTLSIIRQ